MVFSLDHLSNYLQGQRTIPSEAKYSVGLTFTNLSRFICEKFPQYAVTKDANGYYFNKIDETPLSYKRYSLPLEIKELNSLLTISLLAKPFVILTGASGTGKTQQAKALAKHFRKDEHGTNFAVVPVGADWTDNRATLGFINYLTSEGESRYQSTPVVNLLLRANADVNTPYFLILDEMNLSHVERYFADFLSVMEQKDGSIQLHNEKGSLPNSNSEEMAVPQSIPYPRNLFVIGTVNIDETTYMFSPKVLDRANVIEYKVDAEDLTSFLQNPQELAEVPRAQEGEAEQFLALARLVRGEGEPVAHYKAISTETLEEVSAHVMQLFRLMQARRFEFAYRTMNEIMRYLQVSRHLSEDEKSWDADGWKVSLDEQILQRVLPKLHGSVGRVGKLIAQLAHFAHDPDSRQYKEVLADVKGLGEGSPENPVAVYPRSLAKLQEMAETLREEQFVSFI